MILYVKATWQLEWLNGGDLPYINIVIDVFLFSLTRNQLTNAAGHSMVNKSFSIDVYSRWYIMLYFYSIQL